MLASTVGLLNWSRGRERAFLTHATSGPLIRAPVRQTRMYRVPPRDETGYKPTITVAGTSASRLFSLTNSFADPKAVSRVKSVNMFEILASCKSCSASWLSKGAAPATANDGRRFVPRAGRRGKVANLGRIGGARAFPSNKAISPMKKLPPETGGSVH